MHIHQHHYVGH